MSLSNPNYLENWIWLLAASGTVNKSRCGFLPHHILITIDIKVMQLGQKLAKGFCQIKTKVWLLTKPCIFHFRGSTNDKVGQLLFINIYLIMIKNFLSQLISNRKICNLTFRLSLHLEKVFELGKISTNAFRLDLYLINMIYIH